MDANDGIDGANKREQFMRNLDVALSLAAQLGSVIKDTFGTAAVESSNDLQKMSVDEKIDLGNAVSAELYNLAFKLHPESLLDHLEGQLANDRQSIDGAASIIEKIMQT